MRSYAMKIMRPARNILIQHNIINYIQNKFVKRYIIYLTFAETLNGFFETVLKCNYFVIIFRA